MAGPQRVDHMPMDEFKRRAGEQLARGDQFVGKNVLLRVPFDPSFDKFAANVAFELRHLIVYRSDGGRFARGLVRQTGQLERIHMELVKSPPGGGAKATIAARLYRRQDKDPTRRWMISIQFGRQVTSFAHEGEEVYASPIVTKTAEKNFAEQVLHHAAMVVENPKWSGDRQKRLRDWIKLAEKAGYPRFLDLWYYNREPVYEYVSWDTKDDRRKNMTTQTGGNLPFDGTTGSMSGRGTFSAPPNAPWRNFPFRAMIEKCRGRTNIDDCHGLIAEELKLAENSILQSIGEMNSQIKRVSPAAGATAFDPFQITGGQSPFQSSSGASGLGPLAGAFLKHVKTLMDDPNTLYNTYTKYSQSKLTFADNW